MNVSREVSRFGGMQQRKIAAGFIKRFAVVAGVFVLFLLMVILGPGAIHVYYRAGTSETEILAERREYSRLTNLSLVTEGDEAKDLWRRLYKLRLWFRVRGLSIDEGDGDKPIWGPWREMIAFWTDDDGASYW